MMVCTMLKVRQGYPTPFLCCYKPEVSETGESVGTLLCNDDAFIPQWL